ncbi:MAG: hypothetical protein M3N32_07230 [Actinomycetota bacterium]|nr:hypothetical protein [Actinomycetota bacterium]
MVEATEGGTVADGGSEDVRTNNVGREPSNVEFGLDSVDRDGIHLEEPDAMPLEEQYVDLEHVARYGSLEDLIDGFIDAYNAHDFDVLFELLAEDSELPGLGNDRSGFSAAVGAFWDERPNAVLTRGLLEDRPVAVLWDMGDGDGWSRVALFAFDSADDDSEIGLVELIDDAAAIETAETGEPEHDVAEGVRWAEWYEGADGE